MRTGRFPGLLSALFILTALPGWAQREGNIWFFGRNSGIDFNFSPPVPRNQHAMNLPVSEPVVMADPCGNLLFYSDGGTLWNRNHQVMLNGDSLYGGVNNTIQAVLAIPYPDQDSLYLLVTHNQEITSTQNGFWYSVVDMRLDGGRGAVTIKNQFLRGSNAGQLTAVRHANGRDFWVLTAQRAQSFLAFRVSSNGIDSNPVITSIPYQVVADNRMWASPNSHKVAMSVATEDRGNDVAIFDFDNATGQVTGWILPPERVGGGFAFSPDSRKAYFPSNEGLLQYLLDEPNTTAALYLIPGTTGGIGGLRLGPDKRLYINASRNDILNAVLNPNAVRGDLQFQTGVISGLGIFGNLPNNLATFTLGSVTDFTASPLCITAPVQFALQLNYRAVAQQWDFGDPASDEANQSELPNPVHQFSAPGSYPVRLITLDQCGERDTVQKEVAVYPEPSANIPEERVEKCFNEAPVTFSTPTLPLTRYRWNTGDTTSSIQATQTGWYAVEASNPCGSQKDSVYLDVATEVIAYLPDDTIVCEGNFAVLDAQNPGASYLWNTGETTQTIQVDQPGKYYVEIRNRCSQAVDTANLVFIREDLSAFIPNVFTPNGDGINDTFELYVLNTPAFGLTICNRWGKPVFTSKNPFTGWDGRVAGEEAASGVYFWLVTATDCRGAPKTFRGTVHLLR